MRWNRNEVRAEVHSTTDLRAINNEAVFAKHTGMVILGGGLIKHHICNANLMVRVKSTKYVYFKSYILY